MKVKEGFDVYDELPEDMMKQNGVYLDNDDNPYDAVFAANMCKADYLR